MCTQCLLLFLHLKANGHFKPSTSFQGQCLCSLPKWPVTITGCVAVTLRVLKQDEWEVSGVRAGAFFLLYGCCQLPSAGSPVLHGHFSMDSWHPSTQSFVTPSVWQLVTKDTGAVPTAEASCMASGLRGAQLTDTSAGQPGTHRVQTMRTPTRVWH